MAVTDDDRRALHGALSRALAIIDASRLTTPISAEARRHAARTAESLLAASGSGGQSTAVLVAVAEMLGTIAPELDADHDEARQLIARLQDAGGLPPAAVRRGEGQTPPDAIERRLARLRFDLHDGPQQDIHLLAQDLRLFRDQLRPMIAGHADEARAVGRLDDLEAQLVALDDDLRQLLTTVQSPFLTPATLSDGLRQLTEAFAQRTGVVPATRLSGPVASLTDSQQIALLSLIREALSNIRQHSNARRVVIVIDAGSQGVGLEVTDDGSGFDPESTLARAAGAGRLGLVGMHERVRMLGGSTEIHSRPGGPTVISANLPAWTAG